MKKIVILIAFSLFAVSSAFAGDSLTISLTTTGLSVYGAKTGTAATTSPLIGKTSTGVGIGMKTASTGYSVVSQHKNGTKAFGSSFDSTSIYSIDVVAGTATTGPTTADSALYTGSWTSM